MTSNAKLRIQLKSNWIFSLLHLLLYIYIDNACSKVLKQKQNRELKFNSLNLHLIQSQFSFFKFKNIIILLILVTVNSYKSIKSCVYNVDLAP